MNAKDSYKQLYGMVRSIKGLGQFNAARTLCEMCNNDSKPVAWAVYHTLGNDIDRRFGLTSKTLSKKGTAALAEIDKYASYRKRADAFWYKHLRRYSS